MRSSGCFFKTQLPLHTAVGYQAPPGPGVGPNTLFLPPRGTSAGGCNSTAGDLTRFANALLAGVLVRPALVKTLTTAKAHGPEGAYGYGFGIHVDGTFGHTGGAPGIGAELEIDPAHGYVAVVLANRDYPTIIPAVSLVVNAFLFA